MKSLETYNIGLDIGVGSVGWCVTDDNSNILKKGKKHTWGAHIFEEANTAKDRRMYRGAKRRLTRRKERINILQSLLLEDLEKEYPNFLPLLRESSLTFDDKTKSESILGVKYNLFSDKNMTDETYYDQFPTIYHLRKYLMDTKEKVDIRLVYLAIHHIIKYRGNFLYEGDFAENTSEVKENLQNLLEWLKNEYDITITNNIEEILQILQNKKDTKASKKEKIISLFDYDKEEKQVITNVVNSFLGYAFDVNKIFNIDFEKAKISFSSEIENEDELIGLLDSQAEIYQNMKTIYSWFTLQDILGGRAFISEAFIDKYNKYANDLKLLKQIYKTYLPNEYNAMFKKIGKDNYVAYNGKNQGKTCKKCSPDEFFANLKKVIEKLPDECEEKANILNEIADNNFLVKLNVTDNGAIPHQLHQKELKIILENQGKYYKTIENNKQKILDLFSFRIPYYVGPLAKKEGQSKWAWVVRKSDEKILPWNFENVVDEDATAEKFIRRMTNKCTYLINEDVIPKQSLLYSEFCVLNELNNIRINNHHIAKDFKQKIIDEIFKKQKKVTAKNIKDWYRKEGIEVKSLTGLSDGNTFNSNMSSYIDLTRILGKVDEDNYEECENIIYWITIFEDKKILKRKIKKEYSKLTDEQVNQLVKLRYTGWSRLSKELLLGIKSNDNENIMQKLKDTPLNFMQIINNDEYGFNKKIEERMPQSSGKITYKDVDEIPTSPANKRAIWKVMCIVREIVKVMGKEPQNIYIEFARNEEKNKTLKDNRAKDLLKKYDEIEKQIKYLKEYDNNVYKELKKHQSDKTLEEKLYLYFIQNGKCLYSGKKLNIDELNLYEVDHIIPQSYRKDDSIDNKALVIRSENQRKKDSLLLSDEIIEGRKEWWQSLLDSGLISQTKYFRLTRRKMFETDDDMDNFVHRQLVETRQITKYVTNLLVNEYKNTQVYALRANLTHNFREKYNIYKNRNVNNYHHAHDAFILCVIGNILDKYWHGKEEFKYSEYIKNYLKDDKKQNEKFGMIMNFINKYVDIAKVKEQLRYKDCFITRMLIEETGEFYNQTLYSPKDKPVISLKNGLPAEKYGGYSNEFKEYYTIFSYKNDKGKTEYQLVGIPVKIAYDIKNGKENLENYIKENYISGDYTDFKIIRRKILKNQQYLDENNEPMILCSDKEIRADKELILNESMDELIHIMNLDERQLDDNQKEKLENGYEYMFDYLTAKLGKEYKVFSNVYNKLLNKREDFMGLDENNKKMTINGLIDLMEKGQGNLKALGLSDRAGRMSGQNFKTDRLLKMTFIDKSVTGMYERRFKVNGMENNCSK